MGPAPTSRRPQRVRRHRTSPGHAQGNAPGHAPRHAPAPRERCASAGRTGARRYLSRSRQQRRDLFADKPHGSGAALGAARLAGVNCAEQGSLPHVRVAPCCMELQVLLDLEPFRAALGRKRQSECWAALFLLFDLFTALHPPPRGAMPPKEAAPKRNEGVAHAPVLKADVQGCTEAVCGLVTSVEPSAGKGKSRKGRPTTSAMPAKPIAPRPAAPAARPSAPARPRGHLAFAQ